jgi:hypothetical protein
MGKVSREVYTYTTPSSSLDNKIPLAASSTNVGTTLTNTAEIRNKVGTLNDKKGNIVGKIILNKNLNYFGNNDEGYVGNSVLCI